MIVTERYQFDDMHIPWFVCTHYYHRFMSTTIDNLMRCSVLPPRVDGFLGLTKRYQFDDCTSHDSYVLTNIEYLLNVNHNWWSDALFSRTPCWWLAYSEFNTA